MASFMENYDHLAFAFVCGEDLPEPINRIRLDDSLTDQNGLPVPILEYRDSENNQAMERHGLGISARIYEVLGSKRHLQTSGNVSGCHNMGVARMSANPDDGVTNRWGQVHDIPNLFVSDGSLLPTSGAANPTLTIVALAIRQADHIAERMSRKEL
jgi:choline dehydrogenase-like flavoprotein